MKRVEGGKVAQSEGIVWRSFIVTKRHQPDRLDQSDAAKDTTVL